MSSDIVGRKWEIERGNIWFVAWDYDGQCYGFKKRPSKSHIEWLSDGGAVFRLVELDSNGICVGWEESLLDIRNEDSMKYIRALMEL